MATVPERPSILPSLVMALQARWAGLSQRERRLVSVAATVVGVALLWLVLLRPALHTLRTAPAEIAQLQTTLRTAQEQAQELARLAAAPAVAATTSDLRSAVGDWLHTHDAQAEAQITVLPGSITLDVKRLKPQTLLGLAQAARRDWGSSVSQAQLVRGADGLLAGRIQLAQQQGSGNSSP
ncbi:MAG: type II secretion system protein GspM [Thiomonas sp.]|uniref:General secretion pathway, M protein n=1 Tax=mine drainage metagenome TaxID=410659 RepID=E6PK00_9ZZZZ